MLFLLMFVVIVALPVGAAETTQFDDFINAGTNYFQSSRFDLAEQSFKSALLHSELCQNKIQARLIALRNLSAVYKAQGKYKQRDLIEKKIAEAIADGSKTEMSHFLNKEQEVSSRTSFGYSNSLQRNNFPGTRGTRNGPGNIVPYQMDVIFRISKNWHRKNCYSIIFELSIDKNGKVKSAAVVDSTGLPEADDEALSIAKSTEFAPLPEWYREDVLALKIDSARIESFANLPVAEKKYENTGLSTRTKR